MMAMSAMTTVWARQMDKTGARPLGYVDDLHILAEGQDAVDSLNAAAIETERWTAATKQRLSPEKSWVWATYGKLRDAVVREVRLCGKPLTLRSGGRVLGAHLQFTRRKCKGVHGTRLKNAVKRMRRIRGAPLPPRAKRTLTEVAGITAGIYGAEVATIPGGTLETFRTAALHAWWGNRRKQRAPGVARTRGRAHAGLPGRPALSSRMLLAIAKIEV